MTLDRFRASTSAVRPPAGLAPALEALWWLARDDWDKAHKVIQRHEGTPECDLVHAHLHRVEGDLANAGHWYRRAGRPAATGALEDEWSAVAAELLAHAPDSYEE
jgi:hypothetical protein